MPPYFVAGILFLSSLTAFSSTECAVLGSLKVISEELCENSTGSVFHANGQYAGTKGEGWYYSHGTYAGSVGGYWYHANNQYAGSIGRDWFHSNGTYAGIHNDHWYYSNGKYAGINDGSWYDSNGGFLGNFSNMSEIDQLKIVFK